ncbi:hypothetical protein JHK85_048378 [Glycine max]|nr:hypothetical protein JHK85_048378 [Glycine max]
MRNGCILFQRAKIITQVIWLKSELAVGGGMFQDSNENFIGGFASPLSTSSFLLAELISIVTTIENVNANGWRNLQLESDSIVVLEAFKILEAITWKPWRQHASLRPPDLEDLHIKIIILYGFVTILVLCDTIGVNLDSSDNDIVNQIQITQLLWWKAANRDSFTSLVVVCPLLVGASIVHNIYKPNLMM